MLDSDHGEKTDTLDETRGGNHVGWTRLMMAGPAA